MAEIHPSRGQSHQKKFMEEQINMFLESLQESIKELHLLHLSSKGKSGLLEQKGKGTGVISKLKMMQSLNCIKIVLLVQRIYCMFLLRFGKLIKNIKELRLSGKA